MIDCCELRKIMEIEEIELCWRTRCDMCIDCHGTVVDDNDDDDNNDDDEGDRWKWW